MDTNQELFLKLISSSLTGEKYGFSENVPGLDVLYEISKSNSCSSLIWQGAVNCGIGLSSRFKHVSSYTVIDSYKKLQIQKEIVDILIQNGIRHCILKGSTVSLNYPNPLARSMGDIDILVDEENYEKSALLFTTQKVIDANRHDFHIGFNYKNVKIEIHKKITEGNDTVASLEELLKDALNHTQIKFCEGIEISMLTNDYQSVSLLEHMLRHFKDNEFVFRMFCDWVCFVKSVSCDEWDTSVYPFIEKAHLSKFCDTLNKCSSIYLGIDLCKKSNNDIDDKICHILMEEFLSVDKAYKMGGIDTTLGTLISRYRKENKNAVSAYICAVNRIAKNKYSIGKIKIFSPLFWVWLPLKYAFNVILGRRKKINFSKIGKVAKKRETLFNTFSSDSK